MRRFLLLCTGAATLLALSGCAGPNPFEGTPGRDGVAGFLAGLWHGATSLFTLLISMFDHNVRVYEVHNTGATYNVGFVMGTWWLFAAGLGNKRRGGR